MPGLTDIFASERGIFTLLLIVAATVLAAMGIMTIADWKGFVQFVFVTYVTGKTITSATGIVKGGKPDDTTTPAAPAPGASS